MRIVKDSYVTNKNSPYYHYDCNICGLPADDIEDIDKHLINNHHLIRFLEEVKDPVVSNILWQVRRRVLR